MPPPIHGVGIPHTKKLQVSAHTNYSLSNLTYSLTKSELRAPLVRRERVRKRLKHGAWSNDENRSMVQWRRQLQGLFCFTILPFSHQNCARIMSVSSQQVKQNISRKSAVKQSVPCASGAFIRPLFPSLFTVNPLFPDFRVLRRIMCDKQIESQRIQRDLIGRFNDNDRAPYKQPREKPRVVRSLILKSITSRDPTRASFDSLHMGLSTLKREINHKNNFILHPSTY